MRLGAFLAGVAVFAAGLAGAAERQIEFKPLRHPRMAGSGRHVRLDAKGRAEFDFPTKTGRLLVEVAGGRVRIDSNLDGAIDKADGEGVPAAPNYMKPECLEVVVKSAGRNWRYPIYVQYAKLPHLMLRGAAFLQGELDGTTVDLLDSNLDGRFDGFGVDAARTGSGRETRLARLMSLGGGLFNLAFSEDGRSLLLAPYEGSTSSVTLECEEAMQCSVTLAAEGGARFELSKGKAHLVPTGTYRIAQVNLGLRVGSGVRGGNVASLRGQGSRRAFLATEGDCRLRVGPPFKLEFEAYRWGDDGKGVEISDGPHLVGAAGELYTPSVYAGGESSELTVNLRSGKAERQLSKMEFG